MIAVRLKTEIEERLAALARRTGRTKVSFAREAIIEHLGDLEDSYLALRRLAKPARQYTSREVKRELGPRV